MQLTAVENVKRPKFSNAGGYRYHWGLPNFWWDGIFE